MENLSEWPEIPGDREKVLVDIVLSHFQKPKSVAVPERSALQSKIEMAAEETVVKTDTREEPATDVPWNVVVFNDPVNLMSYVTYVFQTVFGYPRERAEKHMMEVHEQGRSILWTGHREAAESYVEKLHGHLLLAQIEKSR